MADKLCVFCKHFRLEPEDPGYSDYTPGDAGSVGCHLGKWRMSKYSDEKNFRKIIVGARTCDKYECAGDNAQ